MCCGPFGSADPAMPENGVANRDDALVNNPSSLDGPWALHNRILLGDGSGECASLLWTARNKQFSSNSEISTGMTMAKSKMKFNESEFIQDSA